MAISEEGWELIMFLAFLDQVRRESERFHRTLPRGWHRAAVQLGDYAGAITKAITEAVEEQRHSEVE